MDEETKTDAQNEGQSPDAEQTGTGAAAAQQAATTEAVPISADISATGPSTKTISGQSIIDPVNRIEGHLRIDMEVVNGVVADAWVTGGLFRGMELVLQGREPADAAYISQRICGVCPVSHAHAACFAGEAAYGIEIPNTARIIRNILEAAQFLHSHILWFYNLAALDYVNPLNALEADPEATLKLAYDAGTGISDFGAVQKRLEAFAANGQLSIFSGNWFDTKDEAYNLPPELDLICTAHYLEALEMQSVASEISGLVGGKMPHVMSSIPGGTTWVPTEEKLDDILFRAIRIRDWVASTMIPDTYAIAPYYLDVADYGQGVGRYIAWGVFDQESRDPVERYLPAGVWGFDSSSVEAPDEAAITEETSRAFYKDAGEPVNPRQGITEPEYPPEGASRDGRYTWDKAPRYNGKPYEAGGLARLFVAYNRGNSFIKTELDNLLRYLSSEAGAPLGVDVLASTLGRTAARNVETLYIANLLVDWTHELIGVLGNPDSDKSTFTQPERYDGEGAGMWEAPRGALYHYEKISGDAIDKYQIIIPSTWNISPRDASGVRGPMEEALIGVPVADLDKPIHALRTVHSFDPCVACAVHITEPATGKSFSTVTSPWGVK
ncbi:MAG: nickel-dependent hydrogenase large subunit [Coriobacteriales bacterium]|jgi:hydrogenase large subunit|nr:nickel-dependent hydrogenase large subunit [Coriobacteriales bacterium]